MTMNKILIIGNLGSDPEMRIPLTGTLLHHLLLLPIGDIELVMVKIGKKLNGSESVHGIG